MDFHWPSTYQQTNICIPTYINYRLAEVPGTARVNLQPAEHLLFCKQFSNMCPSAFRVSGTQVYGLKGLGSKLHQSLPWTGRDVRTKFYQDLCRGLDFQ